MTAEQKENLHNTIFFIPLCLWVLWLIVTCCAVMLWEQITDRLRLVKMASLCVIAFVSIKAYAAPVLINGVYAISNSPAAVALAWDASTDPSVTGYRLYWGSASRQYTNYASTSAATLSVSNLALGKTFYCAVTAYASNGLESDFSQEVTYTVPNAPINTTNLHSPVVLMVKSAPSATSKLWAEVGGFEIDPTLNQFFKLELQKNQVAVTTPAIARKIKTPLPPLPGQ